MVKGAISAVGSFYLKWRLDGWMGLESGQNATLYSLRFGTGEWSVISSTLSKALIWFCILGIYWNASSASNRLVIKDGGNGTQTSFLIAYPRITKRKPFYKPDIVRKRIIWKCKENHIIKYTFGIHASFSYLLSKKKRKFRLNIAGHFIAHVCSLRINCKIKFFK